MRLSPPLVCCVIMSVKLFMQIQFCIEIKFQAALFRRHLGTQQQWIGRTVMVENNDVDSAMKVLNGNIFHRQN